VKVAVVGKDTGPLEGVPEGAARNEDRRSEKFLVRVDSVYALSGDPPNGRPSFDRDRLWLDLDVDERDHKPAAAASTGCAAGRRRYMYHTTTGAG